MAFPTERPAPREPEDTGLLRMMRQAVTDTGFSYSEIARRSGMHRSSVSHLVSGQRAGSVETWDRILRGAGIEFGYRIKRETQP